MNLDTAKQMYISLYKHIPGFQGAGIGEKTIKVYIDKEETKKDLPNTMGIYKVEFEVVGELVSLTTIPRIEDEHWSPYDAQDEPWNHT